MGGVKQIYATFATMKATVKPFMALFVFCFLVFLGVKAGHSETLAASCGEEAAVWVVAEGASSDEGVGEAFSPLTSEGLPMNVLRGDSHKLARRVGTSFERTYRFASVETRLFIKSLLRKMAVRMNCLADHFFRSSDAADVLSWDYACECYIYGMRRILI